MMAEKLVHVGALKGPHGLKGMVKAKIGLDDYDLLIDAGPLLADDGRQFTVLRWNAVGQGLVALTLEGITTIEQAETLRNVTVSLDRERFPEDEETLYLDSLPGMEVLGPDGAVVGTVDSWQELPAGPALNVRMGDELKVLPLEDAFVSLGDTVELTDLGLAVLSI